MKKPALVSLVFALLMSLTALAQNAPEKDNQKQDNTKSASHTETVTGCLQKGDKAGEFSITSEDGKTWGLHSSIKLDQHVGHKVTVSGPVTRESKAEEKKEGQLENASGKEEYGELRVTSLKMVRLERYDKETRLTFLASGRTTRPLLRPLKAKAD